MIAIGGMISSIHALAEDIILKDQVLDMLDENERSPDQLINHSKDYRTIR